MKKLIKIYWFPAGVIIILLLGAFLRFYRYEDRWGFAYDQAYDVIVAKYAIEEHKLPILGRFSSAGPFQTGGQWYWIIMAGILIFPFWVNGPWIFITLLYLLFVLGMIYFGKELLGKSFGLLVGLFTAVSTAQITQGTNLTNQSPLALFSLLTLWSGYLYVKTKKPVWIFIMGFSTSTAATIHLQGVMVFLPLVLTLVLAGKLPTRKNILFLFLGILLPLVPLLMYEINHGFYNTKNIITYQFFNKHKISYDQLGRRWLTYIGNFWPENWSFIIGGNIMIGYLFFFGTPFLVIWHALKKKVKKEWYVIFLTCAISVIYLRYVRTPLFQSYLVFLHPFVLLITARAVYYFLRFRFIIGLLLTVVIVLMSFMLSVDHIQRATNRMSEEAGHWADVLVNNYPNKKFTMFDYKYYSGSYSLPLVYYLYHKDKIDDSGYRVSFGISSEDKKFHKMIKGNKMRFELWDMNASSSAQLQKAGYAFMNPSEVYRSTQDWQK